MIIALLQASAAWPPRVTAVATGVGALLAILALCGALFQISQNRRIAREDPPLQVSLASERRRG